MIIFFKKYIDSILIIVGVVLVLASFSLLVFTRYDENRQTQHAQAIIEQIKELLPDLSEGIPDKNADRDSAMPVIDIDGAGYAGILQIQSVNLILPVAGDAVKYAPYCLAGNAKSETLVVGGISKEYKKILNINEGDSILFTDVRGNVWRYRVEEIVRTEHGDFKSDAALTFKVKHKDAWIFICCKSA